MSNEKSHVGLYMGVSTRTLVGFGKVLDLACQAMGHPTHKVAGSREVWQCRCGKVRVEVRDPEPGPWQRE